MLENSDAHLERSKASLSLVDLVQIQPAVAPADLVAVPTARSVALTGRGGNTGRRHRIPAVTLAEVLDAEEGKVLAGCGALLHGQDVVEIGAAGQGTPVGGLGVTPIVFVAS